MADLTHTAVGTWSGGRFMHFGEPLDDERLAALVRPGDGIDTVLTADAYGAGEADALLGRALVGVPRDEYALVGAIGHDFYAGERQGAKGFPRFTDPRLRGPDAYGDYVRMATERSLERIGVSSFDLLLLHNPDRTGYTSEAVWDAMARVRDEGLSARIGVAPGPANGFTLDLIACLERHGVSVITRVVDYGGLFHDDVLPGHPFPEWDHRSFRPPGWIERGRERLDRMRPIAERHGLTPLQLACAWNLAHTPVRCVAPTLIQEPGPDARPIEDKRAELAAVPALPPLTQEEVAEIRAIGDNTGSMALKGAAPGFDGAAAADRWPLSAELSAVAGRWGIDPERDLVRN